MTLRTPERAADTTRRRHGGIILIVTTGIVLAVVYFPAMFDQFAAYDDEGYLLMSIRNFLKHGGLYHDTFTQYGPFYYLVTAPIYWISGAQPTHDNGRLIVLVFTALSAGLFGAAVWRVTRSLPWTLLCEIATFLLLISRNRTEPMHPGSLIALLLAVLTYASVEFAASRRNWALVVAGAAIGGLVMTKVNVGLFAIGAIFLALVIGNPRINLRIQAWLVAIAAVSPLLLVHRRLEDPAVVLLALLVSFAVLELCVFSLARHELTVSRSSLLSMLSGFAAITSGAFAFALATGSSFGEVVDGVVLRPLRSPDVLFGSPPMTIDWLVVVSTLSVIALVTWVSPRRDQVVAATGVAWPALVLAAAALLLLSAGVTGFAGFAAWLLPFALLPAVVWIVGARPEAHVALRLVVPVAVLQVLHAYPVPGSQLVWATVVMAVPCVIALSAGSEHLTPWRTASRTARALVIAALCLLFAITMTLWPVALWKAYADSPSLDLPGASLLRIDKLQTDRLRTLTQAVRDNCDALWFANFGLGSYYIFSGLPSPTGLVTTGWPKAFTREEKKRVVRALTRSERRGERVCVIHKPNAREHAPDPLVTYLRGFKTKLESSHHFSLRTR